MIMLCFDTAFLVTKSLTPFWVWGITPIEHPATAYHKADTAPSCPRHT